MRRGQLNRPEALCEQGDLIWKDEARLVETSDGDDGTAALVNAGNAGTHSEVQAKKS